MKLSIQVALVIAASLTHTALVSGLQCGTGCAACWKDNNSDGTDIKFQCNEKAPNNKDCGKGCPSGYNGIHCAAWERC